MVAGSPEAFVPTLTTFAIYFTILITIGCVAYYFTKDFADYVLAGRGLNGIITALGVGASDMSGWLMLGLPGAVYASGLNQLWMPIGLLLGAYVNWKFVAPRLRVFTETANDSLTIPAYFDNRFFDTEKTLRIVSAVVILVFFTFYAAAGLVGGARVFAIAFDMSYLHALWISTPIIIIYASIGGFLAVNWVDLFQGILMLFALLLLPTLALFELGGWSHTLFIVEKAGSHYLDIHQGTSSLKILSLMGWGLGYFGQLHLLVRFMAAKTPRVITTARRICLSWMILALIGAMLIGFVGIAYFAKSPLKNPEHVFLAFSKILVNPWIAGVLFAAVLSAIISTVAAQLLAASSALAEDFYHALIHKTASEKTLMWVGRSTVIIVALFAFVLAYNPEARVLSLVQYAWAGLGSSFGPVILLSLHWRNMTKTGAITGIVLGGLTVVAWHVLGHYFDAAKHLYEIIPGFIGGVLGCLLGTYYSSAPSEKMQQLFDKCEHNLKQTALWT